MVGKPIFFSFLNGIAIFILSKFETKNYKNLCIPKKSTTFVGDFIK